MVISFIKNSIEKQLSLKEYNNRNKKILFKRRTGGFGDILMMRMIFEDIKKEYPDFSIHWAIPSKYIQIGSHPFVDEIVEYEKVNRKNYINSINLSEACITYEMVHKKNCDLHRSDIWANKCGVTLKNHNMFLTPCSKSLEKIKNLIEENKKFKNSKTILFCPYSANIAKDLEDKQIKFIIDYLEKLKINCFIVHNQTDLRLINKQYPLLEINNFKDVIAAHYLADGTISVDTGHLHCAAGLKKPLMGIFGYIDGYVYCKYYDLVLLQKHRKNNNWSCDGPCWFYLECSVPHSTQQKPCMTMLSEEEISEKINLFLNKYNI